MWNYGRLRFRLEYRHTFKLHYCQISGSNFIVRQGECNKVLWLRDFNVRALIKRIGRRHVANVVMRYAILVGGAFHLKYNNELRLAMIYILNVTSVTSTIFFYKYQLTTYPYVLHKDQGLEINSRDTSLLKLIKLFLSETTSDKATSPTYYPGLEYKKHWQYNSTYFAILMCMT